MNKFIDIFYSFSVWVMRFAYLNILWLLLTCAGLVVFGLFPATVAMFTVTRRWVMKEYEVSVFKSFMKAYKQEFIKSNVLGFILLLIGGLLYFDLRILQGTAIYLLTPIYLLILILSFLFILSVLYVFPILVHYESNILKVIQSAVLMMLIHPLYTVTMIATTFSVSYIFSLVPGLIPFFSGSLLSFSLMWFSHQVFIKNEEKQLTYEHEHGV
jgi:uncharacterized membrane protein YesL